MSPDEACLCSDLLNREAVQVVLNPGHDFACGFWEGLPVDALIEQVMQSSQCEIVAALVVRVVLMSHAPIGYRVRANDRTSPNTFTVKVMGDPDCVLAGRRLARARRFRQRFPEIRAQGKIGS